MSSGIYTTQLVCEHCGGNGEDPICSKNAGASFHVFLDDFPAAAPGSAPSGVSDVATHVINLDAPPEERWSHIIPRYSDAIRALVPVIRREMHHKAEGFAEAVAELVAALPSRFDFVREFAGISKLTGVDLPTLMAGNLWLETGGMGCSSLVARTDIGSLGGPAGVTAPYLIRTMDWQIPEFRIGTIQVKFVRQGRILFVATTHTAFIGMITASSPTFGVSVNHRREDDVHGDIGKRRLAQLQRVLDGVRLGRAPVSFFVRHVMENASSYAEAVALISSTDLMAPCYFNLIGAAEDEGCVISRAPSAMHSFPIWQLAKDGPATCQTNSDIFATSVDATRANGDSSGTNASSIWQLLQWVPTEEHECARRRLAQEEIARLTAGGHLLTPHDMWEIMGASLINNPETIFTTSMCPVAGHYASCIGAEKKESALTPCSSAGCEFFGTADMNGLCSGCYIRAALS